MAKQTFIEGFTATTLDGRSLVVTSVRKKETGTGQNIYEYTIDGEPCDKPVESQKLKALLGLTVVQQVRKGAKIEICTAKEDGKVFDSLLSDVRTASKNADSKLSTSTAFNTLAKRCGRDSVSAKLAVMDIYSTLANNLQDVDSAAVAGALGLKESTVSKVVAYIADTYKREARQRYIELYHDFRVKQSEHRAAAAAAAKRAAESAAAAEKRQRNAAAKQAAESIDAGTLLQLAALSPEQLAAVLAAANAAAV